MMPSRRRRYERALKRAREQSMLVVAATSAVTDRRRERRRAPGVDGDCALIEREIDTLIAAQENDMLAAIERALRLLQNNPESYGHCAECGREIDPEYLDIAPWLSHCIEHAHGAVTF